MEIYTEALGVIVLACLGGFVGYKISRLPGKFWLLGYIVPVILMILVGGSRWFDHLNFKPPFCWLMVGRMEFLILAVSAMMLVMTLVPHLPRKREGLLLTILFVIFVSYYTIFPFLEPIVLKQELTELKTFIDLDGVCRQRVNYTCGPASAVTALHNLGIEASEGQIAISARSCRSAGTAADLLCSVLQQHYVDDRFDCKYQAFDSIEELCDKCPVIAQIHYSLLVDHFVTVLKIEGDDVIIGDPIASLRYMSRSDFEKIWRFTGITFPQKNSTAK